MPVFWSGHYSLGNDEVDHQHEHILGLVNALELAGTSGGGAATADLVLGHLTRYLLRHFAAEEALMEALGYPELDVHREQHTRCGRKMEEFRAAVEAGAKNPVDCVPFVREWLHTHMLGSDQAYSAWFEGNRDKIAAWAAQMEELHAEEVIPALPAEQPER
jgi:hemerythrin